jgi:hypothetical protein
MPTVIGDKKQELNLSYLQTVAAIAGFAFNVRRQDYGIDGSFHGIGQLATGEYYEKTWALNYQAKATVRAKRLTDEATISYALKAEAYNKLVHANNEGPTPCLLIVLALPQDESAWAQFDEDFLAMSGCCYWSIIRDDNHNASSVTVRLPRVNQFNPKALADLYQSVIDGSL